MLGLSLLAAVSTATGLQRQTAEYASRPSVYAFQYLLYLPPGYNADLTADWPLVLFLHGAGERGTDIERVAVNGPPLLIEQGRDFPSVVVSPQCPPGLSWDSAALEAFLEDLMARYRIDPDRVYVTGLSMGGYGTWALAVRHPETYAAAVPICGGGDPTLAYRLRDLPLWAFHGALDYTVPVARTQEMIDAIRRAGGSPQLTIYPELGHDAWTVTYANDALYAWLFAHNRVRPATPPAVATQAQAQTATAGRDVTFTVTATGSPAPTFQWQRLPAGTTIWEDLHEGGSYLGTTGTTLAVNAVTSAMSGDQFRCVVTSSAGSATSEAVALTVTGGTSSTLLQYPASVAMDDAGNLYVADASSNTIRKIAPSGVVSTLAGLAGGAGSQDGSGTAARFNQPGGLAVDPAGNVYVADGGNAIIRKITPAGAVTTLAGSPANRGSRDGVGSAAWFNQPAGIAVDLAGNLYVTDSMDATVRRITSDGTVTTVAGLAGNRGDADGAGTAARFNHPTGVAVGPGAVIYVVDTYNHTVRRITPDGVVTTLAGSPGLTGANDGNGRYALFSQPCGVAVDPASDAGSFCVADTGNGIIRRVTPLGEVTTVAGIAGIAGLADGAGSGALFNQPRGVAVDHSHNILVADTGNAVVRRISPDTNVITLALTGVPSDDTTPSPSGGNQPVPGSATQSASGGGGMPAWFVSTLAVLWAARTSRCQLESRPHRHTSRASPDEAPPS